MRIHSFTPSTYVNGPGKRAMIHFQGCTLNCPGCFNSTTHTSKSGMEISTEGILALLPPDIDGVTISGGEPFQQAESLFQLVEALRKLDLSIAVFSGFYRKEIASIPSGPQILSMIDVLIDGRFDENQIATTGIRGSSNQTIHLITQRHTTADFEERNIEVIVDAQGNFSMTGFPSDEFRKEMNDMGL